MTMPREQAAHLLAHEIEAVCARRELAAYRKRGAVRNVTVHQFYDPHAATELAELILRRMA